MKIQNKWEQLFEQFMDLTEFSLIKHKNPELVLHYKDCDGNEYEEINEGVWSVYDRQGANLGDIESDRFDNAEDVFDRMDVYIADYFYAALEDELDAYEVDLEGREIPNNATDWLLLRNDVEFVSNNKKYFDDHSWDFDVLDMITNHANEINLENCNYEED